MEFADEFGNVVSEEQLEKWDEEISAGDFSGWKPVGEVHYGPLRPLNEKKEYISIQVPAALKVAIKTKAQQSNCTQSELIRRYIYDGLVH